MLITNQNRNIDRKCTWKDPEASLWKNRVRTHKVESHINKYNQPSQSDSLVEESLLVIKKSDICSHSSSSASLPEFSVFSLKPVLRSVIDSTSDLERADERWRRFFGGS